MSETSEMVCVPRKPTKTMLHAAAKAMSPGRRPTPDWMSVKEKHAVRYEAMISAYLESLSPPDNADEDGDMGGSR